MATIIIRFLARALLVGAAVAASACAPSLSSQVSTVQSLAQVQDLPDLREDDVDPSSVADANQILERPLTADAAVRVALLNNRELRARLRELGVPAGELVSAGLIANPTFEFELLPERDTEYELRVEYDITSLLVAPVRSGAAQAELEAARLRVASEVLQLGYDVRTRFYDLQAAQRRLEVAQQSLNALAASRDAAQALLDAGNIRALDAASQIAAHERARVSVAKLELELAERREEMQRMLGVHGDQTTWRIEGVLAEPPTQIAVPRDIESSALETNLDLKATRKQLESLSKQTAAIRTQGLVPEIAADVHALRVEPEDEGDDSWRWGAGVSVEVPLFDRGQGRLRSVESQFDAALERFHGLAISVRSAARDARNRLTSAHSRARQYQTVILPAQRAVLEQTLLQYNAMQLGVFELLAVQRELLDVELAYTDTLREYWTAQAELEALRRGRMVVIAAVTQSTRPEASATDQGGH